jgi:hypothetical protein
MITIRKRIKKFLTEDGKIIFVTAGFEVQKNQ